MNLHRYKLARPLNIGKTLVLTAAMLLILCQFDGKAFAQNFPNFHLWQQGDLRGFNVPTYLRDHDWQAFESTGANLARVFLNLHRAGSSNQFQLPANAYQDIDRMVEQSRRRGFKIVVTFNPQPKAPDLTYWFNSAQQDSIVAIIEAFARRYSGDNAFAGFDILNEPYPVTKGHRNVPQNFDGPTAWRNLASRIITAVRRQDPTRVIVYEFPYWSAQYGIMQPLPFQGVVYSSHWYMPHDITHQGVSGRPLGVSYPSAAGSRAGMWNKEVIRQKLEPVRRFQQTYGLPVYFGEFSCTRKAPGQSATQYAADVLSIFEEYNWTWTYHAFREAPDWDAELARGNRSEGRSMNTETMAHLRQMMARNP